MSAAGMLGFALLPGMPTAVFITISAIALGSGLFQLWRTKQQDSQQQADQLQAQQLAPEDNGHQDLRRFNPTRAYLLQFSPAHSNGEAAESLIQHIRRLRNRLVYHFGFTLPSFDIEFSPVLGDDEFRFCVYEIPLVTATFAVEQLAVRKSSIELHAADGDSDGQIQPGEAERDEHHWCWLPPQHPLLQQEDRRYWNAEQLIMLRMEQAIHQSGAQFIGLQESKSILNWLESEQPELAQELQRIMPLSRFAAVLQQIGRAHV